MHPGKHTIKKFSLNLVNQQKEHSYALQSKCSKLIKDQLVNKLDFVLSEQFTGEDIFRINKIEIDLGDIYSDDLEKEFVEKCLAGLSQQLKAVNYNKTINPEEPAIKKISRKDYDLEQFFYFLATGNLPSLFKDVSFTEWQQYILFAIENKKIYFLKRLKEEYNRNPEIVDRLIAQFDENFITKLVLFNNPSVSLWVNNIFNLFNQAPAVYEVLLIKKKVLQVILPLLLGITKTPDKYIEGNIFNFLSDEKIFTDDKKIILSLKKNIEAIIQAGVQQLAVTNVDKEKGNEISVQGDKEEMKREIEKDKIIKAEDDKAVFIHNAGIILLHPFLHPFFKITGLIKTESFEDEGAAQKAVHLLQYLVNKQQQLPEYEMQLNKILCGIDNDKHLDRCITLSEKDIEEANELLRAVITHWEALKNTSVDALQETFIQRNGKLSFNETEGSWKLQVERKAVDILLDKIPWGISYIKLPWMKYALVTEW